MIKFFRKIRYDLMETGKTTKYLKYAIGEIILVVIGILIALSINNWNEERKDRIREQSILKNLQIDFKSNINNVDKTYNSFLEAYEASAKLLEIISTNEIIDGYEIEHLLDEIINKCNKANIEENNLALMIIE